MERRNLMNLILVSSAGATIAGLGGPFVAFFYPPSAGGGGGGVSAKDALGNDVTMTGWLASHPPGDHSLTQGLKGDATYLIVKEDKTIENVSWLAERGGGGERKKCNKPGGGH